MTYENAPQPQHDRITLLWQNPEEGGNKPHFKGFITLGGVEYEFATWPAKSGNPGSYSGTVKPKGART